MLTMKAQILMILMLLMMMMLMLLFYHARPGKTVWARLAAITGTAMFLNATTKTPSWVGGSTHKGGNIVRLEERDRLI
jgi:hypothetical protein